LIQILSIKNFGRAVPRFGVKIATRINRLAGRGRRPKAHVGREGGLCCPEKAGK